MHPSPINRDPLAPVDFVVTVLASLLALGLLAAVPIVLFNNGSFAGIGEDDPSVKVRSGAVSYFFADNGTDFQSEGVEGLRDGAQSMPYVLSITDSEASPGQQVRAAMPEVVSMLWLAGLLLLSHRAIRSARTHGPFTRPVAVATRRVGWWMLLGSLVVMAVQAFFTAWFLTHVVDGIDLREVTMSLLDAPWVVLIAAATVLTLARLLAQATGLQDEADLTV